MKKAILLTTTLLAGAAGLYFIQNNEYASKDTEVVQTQEVVIGGEFSLKNQFGEAVSYKDFKGKLMLVYFGFSYCPDVCPTDLAKMTAAIHSLGDKSEQVSPIFITVDPERDTVEQLKTYAANFHPRLQALTGDKAQIDRVVKAYKVYASKTENKELTEYQMNHSAYMYLMNENGEYITHFTREDDAEAIAALIKENVRERF